LGKQPEYDTNDWWDEWLEVQVERVWAYYWLAQWPEMDMLVNKVQPVVQERGGAAGRQRFLMASFLMQVRRDRYVVSDDTLANSREQLALCQERSGLKIRIDCQFQLGFGLLWRHEHDEAEENLQAVLELAETCGIVPMRALSLTYLTVLCRFRGRMDGVQNYALRAQESAEGAHMPDYVAAAKGNQAWLAWRRGNLVRVEQLGQEALTLWQQSPLVYPFQWQAIWPLVAVALAQGHEDEAWAYAQGLIEPTQQYLPDELNNLLEVAIQAKAEGQAGSARSHLDRAIKLAQEMGYL
jgi:hypothetical protein